MNDSTIKEALAYSLGSDLHEEWRAPRRLEDGTFEPRMKKSKDEAWTAAHGTDDVDIANCTFAELPSNWQYENLEAARVAVNLVYDGVVEAKQYTPEEIEMMASDVHEAWLQRNDWVFDPNYGNPAQAVPYLQLSEEEKAKDRVQVLAGIKKVQAYTRGEIDIESIMASYGIEPKGKTL